jgi:hypothetical protein
MGITGGIVFFDIRCRLLDGTAILNLTAKGAKEECAYMASSLCALCALCDLCG